MNLIAKKLHALPLNTGICLFYGPAENANSVKGVITDRDESCMEINEKGAVHYVSYADVRSFIISQKVGQDNSDAVPAKKLLHEMKIEHFSQKVSDYDLRRLFGDLAREEKLILQRAVDSFFHGVKTGSIEKCAYAATLARKTIYDEMAQGHHEFSMEALRLVAQMLSRADINDWNLYEAAGMHRDAALSGFKEKEFYIAGVQAAHALLDQECQFVKDMLVVLETSCIQLNDASLIPLLQQAAVDVNEVIEDLILYRGQKPTDNARENLEMLNGLYPNKGVADSINWVLCPGRKAVELVGVISKILWANSTGEITTFNGETETVWPFRYADVEDKQLLDLIEKGGSGLVPRHWIVSFVNKNGKAIAIRSASPALTEAYNAFDIKMYEKACWFCKHSEGTKDEGNALALMAQAAVLSANRCLKEDCADYIEAHRDAYPTSSKTLSWLGQLHHAIGELEEAVRLTEQALKDYTLPDNMRAGLMIQAGNFRMDVYRETEDVSWIKDLVHVADEWLALFAKHEGDPCFTKKHAVMRRWRIYGFMARGKVSEAEQAYTAFVARFPRDSKLEMISQHLSLMRRELHMKTVVETKAPMETIEKGCLPGPVTAAGAEILDPELKKLVDMVSRDPEQCIGCGTDVLTEMLSNYTQRTIDPNQLRSFSLLLADLMRNSTIVAYQAELAYQLSCGNPELCAKLLLQGERLLLDTTGVAKEFGLDEEYIQTSIAKTNLAIVFPAIESIRFAVIQRNKGILSVCLPVWNAEGQRIDDVHELEISTLSYVIKNARLEVNFAELIHLAAAVRNQIAHNKPVSIIAVKEILAFTERRK